jgi:hypothetical protein
MNFKQHHSDLKNKLLKLENKRLSEKTGKLKDTFHKGVYVISQFEDQDSYKIGLARGSSGLYQRVKSYAICYPYSDELWVHFMVICLSTTAAEKFEKVVLANKGLHKVEKNPTKGSLEWRVDSRYHSVKDAITQACVDHPNLWQKIIVFGKNGYQVIHNDLTKKYTRATFKLEKPLDSFTGKTNVYGTNEFLAVRKPGRRAKPIAPAKPLPPIPAPKGKFAKHTDDLAGRTILFKWDSSKPGDPRGWFKGHVLARKTTKREQAKGFNWNVKYTKADTNGEIMGTVATGLFALNYGKKWVLLRK